MPTLTALLQHTDIIVLRIMNAHYPFYFVLEEAVVARVAVMR